MTWHSVLDPALTVTMLRHAESVQNFLGKQAVAHLPESRILLTAAGRKQGRDTGELLDRDFTARGVARAIVLVSPAKRTTQTMQLIAGAGSGKVEYLIRVMEELKETCLMPREEEAALEPLPPGDGLFRRRLVTSDTSRAGLMRRLEAIPREINRLAHKTEITEFVLITHKTTGRLIAGNQFLGMELDTLDGFRPFGNAELWRFDSTGLRILGKEGFTAF